MITRGKQAEAYAKKPLFNIVRLEVPRALYKFGQIHLVDLRDRLQIVERNVKCDER